MLGIALAVPDSWSVVPYTEMLPVRSPVCAHEGGDRSRLLSHINVSVPLESMKKYPQVRSK